MTEQPEPEVDVDLDAPMEIRADVRVVSHLDIDIQGPGGLTAQLHLPDEEEAYDALDEFVAALPQTIRAAMEAAEERADG